MEEKIAVLQSWVNAIENKSIYQKTESECEQAFNLDIFHKVLGYAFYPTENYTLEAKGWNEVSGQKADATLGYFNASDIAKNVSLVQVAVEIKDANTPLTKSQRREWNLSPIQQWFKYKPQYNNCKRVLVTNFVEIRLFKDTQLDYEVWNLIDLVHPENDYQNFKVFWYLLNAKHLIAPVGMESVTEKLLSVVRIQSEQITKKFYQEYKTLRLELINDIRSHNPEVSLDMVLQKSQKVIDRIVFVHFCEDFGLLPEGKLAEVIQYSQSLVGVSIWQILSGFFEAVNSGSSKLGIPNGYNWWLFHEDKELNNLKIGDAICQKFVDLWKYDFQEELSVNILWHIFEQSISDLEDLRINMLGTELETWELGESSKSNKRKKDGIFYTPEYIVDYIVRNSLGKYLEEQFEIIERKHLKKEKQMSDKVYQEKQQLIYGEYKQVLENITVLDPACGSGAFLVKVFDYLLAEHKRVGEALGMGGLFDNESTYKSILQRNIYGVDLNAESVEITKLSLWLKTAEKGKKLADLDNNIKCGNSLIDDPAVAGDKAFDWKKEFADIMNAWGFDVIVGNPPYVRQELLWEANKKFYTQKFPEVYNGIADLYVYFYWLGLQLLKSQWLLWFIAPNKRLERNYWKELRHFLKNQCLEYLVNFWELRIFDDASTEPMIAIIRKAKPKKSVAYVWIKTLQEAKDSSQYQFNTYPLAELRDDIRSFSSKTGKNILEKFIWLWNTTLKEYANNGIYYWIKTWMNKAFIINQDTYNAIIQAEPKAKNILQKLVEWEDFWKWTIQHQWRYLVNTWFDTDIPTLYPKVFEWLSSFSPDIEKRADKWRNRRNLRACDYYDSFPVPKLIYYHTALHHKFYFDTEGYFISANCYMITWVDRYLQCILNSSLFGFVKKYLFPAFGDAENWWRVRLDANKMYTLPIQSISQEKKQKYNDIAENITIASKQLQEKLDFTLRFLQSKFSIEKPSSKLSKFRELDFAWFLKELKVKKLPLDTEAELMRYFEKEKTEVIALKTQIDTLDKQIDDMVFDLYGLTEEERKIVLDS